MGRLLQTNQKKNRTARQNRKRKRHLNFSLGCSYSFFSFLFYYLLFMLLVCVLRFPYYLLVFLVFQQDVYHTSSWGEVLQPCDSVPGNPFVYPIPRKFSLVTCHSLLFIYRNPRVASSINTLLYNSWWILPLPRHHVVVGYGPFLTHLTGAFYICKHFCSIPHLSSQYAYTKRIALLGTTFRINPFICKHFNSSTNTFVVAYAPSNFVTQRTFSIHGNPPPLSPPTGVCPSPPLGR